MQDADEVFFNLAIKVATIGRPSISEILSRNGYMVEADTVSLMEEACPLNIKTNTEINSEKVVYSNQWFQIIKSGRYHFMRENNAKHSAVIIIESNDHYLFVRQYRYALLKDMLELPRGSAKENESSIECAIRELLEESSILLNAEHIVKIGTICPNSGVMASEVDVFFAKIEYDKPRSNSYSDGIKEIVFIPKSNILTLLSSCEITDAFSLSALMLLYAFRGGKW